MMYDLKSARTARRAHAHAHIHDPRYSAKREESQTSRKHHHAIAIAWPPISWVSVTAATAPTGVQSWMCWVVDYEARLGTVLCSPVSPYPIW